MDETIEITKEKVREIFNEWFQDEESVPATIEVQKTEAFLNDCTDYFWDSLVEKS